MLPVYFSSLCGPRMQECMKDTNSFATETGKKPARFIKLAVGMEESVDEFRILEDERCIDKGVPKSLSAARVGVCLRRYPAPATYQLHPPDTVRLVLPRGQLQGARWPCCLVPRARILKATRSGTPAQPSTAPISCTNGDVALQRYLTVRIAASRVPSAGMLDEPFCVKPKGSPDCSGGSSRRDKQECHETGKHAESTALVLRRQTVSTAQSQTSGSGTWMQEETVALLSRHHHFRHDSCSMG